MYEDQKLRQLQETVASSILKGNAALTSAPDVRAITRPTYQQPQYPTQSSSSYQPSSLDYPSSTNAYRTNPWDERNLARVTAGSSSDPLNMNRFNQYPSSSRKPSEILPITSNLRSPQSTGIAPLTTTTAAAAGAFGSPLKQMNSNHPAAADFQFSPVQANQIPNRIDLDQVEETIKRADKAIRNSYAVTQPAPILGIGHNTQADPLAANAVPKYYSDSINAYSSPTPAFSQQRATLPATLTSYPSSNSPTYATANIAPFTSTYPYLPSSNANTDGVASFLVAKEIEVNSYSTKWEDIIERGEKYNIAYSDSEFLPSPASIGGAYPHKVEWVRAGSVMRGASMEMFSGNEIDPTSIVSGDLDNAYFQSAVSALAERDISIFKLFQTKRINRAGCYVLNICWKGVWTAVIIDDKIPVKQDKSITAPMSQISQVLCFTRSSPNELWVVLLEKAWAKLHGSYAKIDGGLPREILHDLTGAPTRMYFLSGEGAISKQRIWETAREIEEMDFVALASAMDDTLSNEQQAIASLYGINNEHAYTVLGTLDATVKGVLHQFVKLRNPKCKQEWSSGTKDVYLEQLSEEMIHALSYGGRCSREGYFIMELDDFCAFFSDLTVCYTYEGFAYTGERVCTARGQSNFLKVEILEAGFYFFSVSQETIRKQNVSEQLYLKEKNHYAQCYFALSLENQQDKLLMAVQGNQRDLTSIQKLENPVFLPAGKYNAFVRADWKSLSSSTGNLGFGVYGVKPVEIRVSSKQHCSVFAAVVESTVQQAATNNQWEEV